MEGGRNGEGFDGRRFQEIVEGFMTDFAATEASRGRAVHPDLDRAIMQTFFETAADRLKIDMDTISAMRPGTNIFEALGLDSIDLMSAVMAIEEPLAIEVPDAALETVTTVEELLRVLREAKLKQSPNPDDPDGDDSNGGSRVREPRGPAPNDSSTSATAEIPVGLDIET